MPIDLWVLGMTDTSKGSTKNNVNGLLGEWEWKDFRIKKKYIYYYNSRRREKLKRNECGGKKDDLTPFSLYKWTKQSCNKLNCRQQISPDWIISRMLKIRIGLLDYCQHQSHHREKSVLPCESQQWDPTFPNGCMPYFAGPNQAICGPVSRILRLEKGQKEDLFLAYFVTSLLYPCHTLSAILRRLILSIPFSF